MLRIIDSARDLFTETLLQHVAPNGLSAQVYQRYLSMQYHLTKGVQRYFFVAAAHADLGRMRKLRKFLCDFANEEELHYLVAAHDLRESGLDLLPPPIDAELWHAYFTQDVTTRPFVRLGAAAVLENLASPENRAVLRSMLTADFLHQANTKFLVLHMHEALPHGDQILNALAAEPLDERQLQDLCEGACKGAVMYLRMVDWAVNPSTVSRRLEPYRAQAISEAEAARISGFEMQELR